MKFPSIIKLAKNRQFEFTPRYYDPIKANLEERTERIQQEIGAKNSKGKDLREGYSSSIKFKRTAQSSSSRTTLVRLMIAAVLSLLLFGWIYYGKDVFYATFLIFPVYIYFRFKHKFTN